MEEQEITTFLKQNIFNRINDSFNPTKQKDVTTGSYFIPNEKSMEVGKLWKAKLNSYFSELPDKVTEEQVDQILSDMRELSFYIVTQVREGEDPDDRQVTDKWKEQIAQTLRKTHSIIRHDLLPKAKQLINQILPKPQRKDFTPKPPLKRPPSINPPLQTPPSLEQRGYTNPQRFMRKLAEVSEPLMQTPDYSSTDSYSNNLNKKNKGKQG